MRRRSQRKTTQHLSVACNKTKQGDFEKELGRPSSSSTSSTLKRNNQLETNNDEVEITDSSK
jgi:hypothetical protein